MASEFLPLHQVIELVESSIVAAGEVIADERGATRFSLGECTIALSVELRTDGRLATARLPSFVEGEPAVPPEYLSRITVTLRPSVTVPDR
jgi:hypothetical protein